MKTAKEIQQEFEATGFMFSSDDVKMKHKEYRFGNTIIWAYDIIEANEKYAKLILGD